MVTLAAGEMVAAGQLFSNEHWLLCDGMLHLELDNHVLELYKGDLALLRAGVVRRLWTDRGARVVLMREQQIPWSRFLDEIAEAGYEWTELGPYGYLPTDQLHQRRAEDYTMLGYGTDYHLLVAAARAGVTAFKE